MAYTNSSMVAYTKLSPNHSGQRTMAIDRITPHCVVGQCTAEGLGDWFAKSSTQASSNYGIDKDGRVGMYVEEKNRSWCSSSNANDQRAITIECASDTTEPYAFREVVYQTLIKLCIDICKRNGKSKLLWIGDKDKTLAYSPKSNEMVLTVHRWFANKSCPGNWLMARMDNLASKVTAALAGTRTAKSGTQATILKDLSEADAIKKVGSLFTANQKSSGILASLSLAQYILESGYGKSELSQNANNLFGINPDLHRGAVYGILLNALFKEAFKMAKYRARQSRRRTPWDDQDDRTATQEFLIQHYRAHYDNKHPALNATGEENLINSYEPETCPYCGSDLFKRDGHSRNGVQRYQCLGCERKFTPLTGTIFDGHKISISEWMEYTLNILRYVSINADSWNNRNAFTTSRYWLEKLFILLAEQENATVLSGRVWLDETFYSVRSEDVIIKEDGTKLRGLSENQLCIGVACTDTTILCLLEGRGQPSKRKTYKTFKDHIAPGSVLVHDKDSAHNLLVEELKLLSEAYDSKYLKTLPDKENPLRRINEVHARLKNFLYAHNSFNRDSLQGYLNLFSLAMNPPSDLLEKVEQLLNLAFQTRKTLRYRDYYGAK